MSATSFNFPFFPLLNLQGFLFDLLKLNQPLLIGFGRNLIVRLREIDCGSVRVVICHVQAAASMGKSGNHRAAAIVMLLLLERFPVQRLPLLLTLAQELGFNLADAVDRLDIKTARTIEISIQEGTDSLLSEVLSGGKKLDGTRGWRESGRRSLLYSCLASSANRR